MKEHKKICDDSRKEQWTAIGAKLQARVFWTVVTIMAMMMGYISVQYINSLKEVHQVRAEQLQKAGEIQRDMGIIQSRLEEYIRYHERRGFENKGTKDGF